MFVFDRMAIDFSVRKLKTKQTKKPSKFTRRWTRVFQMTKMFAWNWRQNRIIIYSRSTKMAFADIITHTLILCLIIINGYRLPHTHRIRVRTEYLHIFSRCPIWLFAFFVYSAKEYNKSLTEQNWMEHMNSSRFHVNVISCIMLSENRFSIHHDSVCVTVTLVAGVDDSFFFCLASFLSLCCRFEICFVERWFWLSTFVLCVLCTLYWVYWMFCVIFLSSSESANMQKCL